MIGHVPTHGEVVFIATGALPYVSPSLEWLVVALKTVLGVTLPTSVVRDVEKIFDAPRSRKKLPPLPVVVRTGGGFTAHAIDLAKSCPPPTALPRRGRVPPRHLLHRVPE